MASSSTGPRPTWRSMTGGGTLPLRNPGTLIWRAMAWYAASRLGLSSSKGTSTVILARVGLNVSTALFTGLSPLGRGPDRGWGRGSGRQDSNLRSPAPKAGALATTLRPGCLNPASLEEKPGRAPIGRTTLPHDSQTGGLWLPWSAPNRHADVAQW